MSTFHHNSDIREERDDKKPHLILDYRRTKGAVDNIDKLIVGTYPTTKKYVGPTSKTNSFRGTECPHGRWSVRRRKPKPHYKKDTLGLLSAISQVGCLWNYMKTSIDQELSVIYFPFPF